MTHEQGATPARPRRSSFIVRLDRDDKGAVSGVIERVRTGKKEPFRGFEAIGGVIARMVEAESARPPAPRAPRARRRARSQPADGEARP
jgi:hypothetical protein